MDTGYIEQKIEYEHKYRVKLELKTNYHMTNSKELKHAVRLLNRRILSATVAFDNQMVALTKAQSAAPKPIEISADVNDKFGELSS